MPDFAELVEQLKALPRKQYSDLIRRVDAERRQAWEREEEHNLPTKGMDRDEFARWIARQHFAIDKGITRILYLPTNAAPTEVRLVEVNELASIPENAPLAAVDFTPDIDGLNYSLFVADITPRQFDDILQGRLPLPIGWQLDGYENLPSGD